MGKVEAVQAHQDAAKAADEALYDAGFQDGVASVPATPGGSTPEQVQAAVDAAVAQAKADAQAVLDQKSVDDAKEMSDAQAVADAKLADVSKQLVDMTAKDQVDAGAVSALQASVASVQAALDTIKGLLQPVPAPVPPEPAQEIPPPPAA